MSKEIFAQRLKALRERSGLTQEQLADEFGLSRGSISFYEKAARTPDIETLETVALFFNVTPNYLLGFSNNLVEENENIGARLGLSDKAIEVLQFYKEREGGCNFSKIINILLEEEELTPLELFVEPAHYPFNYCDYSYEPADALVKGIRALSSICSYVSITTKDVNDVSVAIDDKGMLIIDPDSDSTYDIDIVSVQDSRTIASQILLNEVNESLKEVKEKISPPITTRVKLKFGSQRNKKAKA